MESRLKSIYFIAPKDGVTPIFSISTATREVSVVAEGQYDYESPLIDSTTLLTMRHSMLEPNEILAVKPGGEIKQLTNVNTALLSSIDMPKVVKRMVPTTDGKLMTTWVLYPADFDGTKTYPALLYCQGGPQSAVSQFSPIAGISPLWLPTAIS